MKCEFCGKEFSRNVIAKHKERCLKKPVDKAEDKVEEDEKKESKKGAK